ncbi:hypothetical protein C8Q76DRAFT_790508 [Earliella scabrosa]|nr:hypothetical protein C8Q76DRAFT_790508 [Earliella scabrosa]
MRYSQFMQDVIPSDLAADFDPSGERSRTVHQAFLDALPRLKKSPLTEEDYSRAWAKVDQAHELCPGSVFHLPRTVKIDDWTLKVNGSFISKEDAKRVVPRKPNWRLQRLPAQFKAGGIDLEPFEDRPGYDPETQVPRRKDVRGQVMSYAEHIYRYQHRTAVYLLFINGESFRAMRWDRAGVITTEAVNYIKTPDGTGALLKFLHCFSKLTAKQQGIDTTVVELTPATCGWKRMDEICTCLHDLPDHDHLISDPTTIHEAFLDDAKAKTALGSDDTHLHLDPTHICKNPSSHRPLNPHVLPDFVYVRALWKNSLVRGPRYMFTVSGQRYLAGELAVFTASGLIGRGTRGYVALEWSTQRLVFLKDTWRSYYKGFDSEGTILRRLNAAGVENVPTVIAEEDVEDQETLASEYSPETGPRHVEDLPAFGTATAEQPMDETRVIAPRPKAKKRTTKRTTKRKRETPAQPHNGVQMVQSELSTTAQGPGPSPIADSSSSAAQAQASSSGGAVKRTADEVVAEDRRVQGMGLRRLCHSRLVMKEICLPLMRFANSKQLVTVVADAIAAHESAYTRCGYIHTDVSVGHLLIRARVVKVEGGYTVRRQGVLVDWHVGKHKDDKQAHQPARSATWDFMSIWLLQHPEIPVTIPDELESFLHVLIYPAVRRVRHNFDDIRGFIDSYFHGYSRDHNGRFIGSDTKYMCIMFAKLHTQFAHLRFCDEDGNAGTHPLNRLIVSLLCYFQARYKVLEWNQQKDVPQIPTTGNSACPGSADSSSQSFLGTSEPVPSRKTVFQYSSDKLEATKIKIAADLRSRSEPSEDKSDMATALNDHAAIRTIFAHFLESPEYVWPRNDTVPDRLEGYVPREREFEDVADPDAPETSKRIRRTGRKAAAETNADTVKASISRSRANRASSTAGATMRRRPDRT